MAVTLVIKTPSLKLSDLTYSCDATISVFQLKTYLENQYPSKPVILAVSCSNFTSCVACSRV